jgi:hypothetical protein
MKGDHIVLRPHPLSPVAVRVLRHPQEAEVISQVVGIALKLNGFRWSLYRMWKQESKEPPALN